MLVNILIVGIYTERVNKKLHFSLFSWYTCVSVQCVIYYNTAFYFVMLVHM